MEFTEQLRRIAKAQRMGMKNVEFYVDSKQRLDFCRFLTQRNFTYSFADNDKDLLIVSWSS